MAVEQNDNQSWTKFEYSAQDGLKLAGRKYGWETITDALPVVCLSGLTRNSADFHSLAFYLAHESKTPRRVLCLDYRGRGMSAHDRNWENYNIFVEADDVIAGMIAAGIEHAAIIGTSRGGLIAFVLAASRPSFLNAVIFNDIGPEVDPRGLVRIKNYVEKGTDFSSWPNAVEAVERIGSSQFPDWGPAKWEEQAHLIYAMKKGKVVRRYDKNLMKTLRSIDLDNPLPDMWPQFNGLSGIPVMTIRGANSDLLSQKTVEKMHRQHGNMKSVTIPAQGHAPDLGTPGLPEQIAAFLEEAAHSEQAD